VETLSEIGGNIKVKFTVESLCYNFFPYRHELERIFVKDFTGPSQKEKNALKRYFKHLKPGNMRIITIDE
jgi:hypothetical protein